MFWSEIGSGIGELGSTPLRRTASLFSNWICKSQARDQKAFPRVVFLLSSTKTKGVTVASFSSPFFLIPPSRFLVAFDCQCGVVGFVGPKSNAFWPDSRQTENVSNRKS